MTAAQYVAMRRIEMLVLRIQKEQLWDIRKNFHMLNHTAFAVFAETHVKSAQLRLHHLRWAYYRR